MRDHFFEILRTRLAPALRNDGFLGSGRTFRRSAGEFVHVLNLQGSMSGGECCVNLGVHLAFLPVVGPGGLPDPRRIREPQCEFRSRLTRSGTSDQWWPYGATERECELNAADLIDTYCSAGRSHFDRAVSLPGPFSSISPADLEGDGLSLLPGHTTLARACLALARIHDHLGDAGLARQFAELGLTHVGPAAGLRTELVALSRAT